MTEPRSTPAPRPRHWGLIALIVALAAVAAVAVLSRPRPREPRVAADVTRVKETAVRLPTYTVKRTAQPIRIDGVLDEPAWGHIKPVRALTLHDGSGAPQLETEAKLCWDDKYLYVAFSCVDTDIWGTYTKHDDPIYDQEVVEIFINPSGDLVNYYEFEVSPRNVTWDGRIHNPDNDPKTAKYDPSWECAGLLTGVRVVGTLDNRSDIDQLWSVEMAIPFAAIAQRPPTDGERWRGNLYRIDRAQTDEFSCWSPPQKAGEQPAFHIPKRFGHLIFSARRA
jgi:hypothetical protein